MDIEQALAETAFYNREYMLPHLPYEREMEFYQSIKTGNIKEAQRLFTPLCSDGMGKLSDDPLRNLKYHLIITVAFITRYCIEGGMEMEHAYNLSDAYIQQIDRCQTEKDIHAIHREMVEDYAHRMHVIVREKLFSKPVVQCVDYIYNHLHYKITLKELAKTTGLSESYLSKLFRKEMGVTLSQYISQKRVEAAENLLKYSDFSCVEISDYLCFSSESYFIQVFKAYTKMTPREYRSRYFRTRWGSK
ncbi:MAG: AraC family transcriptional regulator [Eubacterium sp.]|nr:AraC family transcriptional regulator [Eubacterium sp.]